MTERLYYHEPYQVEFEAIVREVAREGARTVVQLDRTAFYPTSGGQPFDTGVLNGSRVVDVVERDDDAIVHVVEGEAERFETGQAVRGRIDWARRFDHMQQHTGQHILSAAFDRLFDARTESFHLGTATSTIDLARELQSEAIVTAEAEANRVVWDDRPVSIRFVTEAEAAALPLRKAPVRAGSLRVIEVEGFDLSACGGTHVARTGAVGGVAIQGWERYKGGTRVEFVCGRRLVAAYRGLNDVVAGSIRMVSVLPGELPQAIERLQSEQRELRRTVKELRDRLAAYEAEAMAARGEPLRGWTVIVEAVEGSDAAGLKSLASAMTTKAGRAVALFSTGEPVLAVVARSANVPADASAVLRGLTGRFGGRGGGKADLAQGGGLSGDIGQILACARDELRQAFG